MKALLARRHGGEAAAGLLLAVTILVFAPTTFGLNGLLEGARPSTKNDFTSYYVAGLAVRQGMPEALYYPQPVGSLLAQASLQHPWIDLAQPAGIDNPNYYLYPPLFALLFAPLTLLPYKVAYLFWAALCAGFLIAAVVALLRSLR
ncbi:MAG TPA: glycosyltransferase family 87 protein, partial [Patescibacteria group bacterium]|nr:glycosyltransferase family 87 protein [Patescibacteria group bacterium]